MGKIDRYRLLSVRWCVVFLSDMAITPDSTSATGSHSVHDAPGRGKNGSGTVRFLPAVTSFPHRTVLLGALGSVLLLVAALGAGGVLLHDPIVGHGPLSWIRYGHGKIFANCLLYTGFALIVWAWVRLGRQAIMGQVSSRTVIIAAGWWIAPLLISPPLFTRDVFSYLGQGAQLLHGLDPYKGGPAELSVLSGVVQNVHPVWQTTPAPYGPLYLLITKWIVSITGENLIAGVIATRLVLLLGLIGLLWGLPRLVRHLGGNVTVTLWLIIASPMMVIHLIGGPHNETLMLGFLVVGVVLMVERQHALAIVLVSIAMLIKPSAAGALPFLVWVWANHLSGENRIKNFFKALLPSVGIFAVIFALGTWVSLGSLNVGWINGMKAPSLVANWLNFPTGLGEIVYSLVHLVVDVPVSPFVTVARTIATYSFIIFAGWQWWRSRFGGTEAIFRMAVTLIAVAVVVPPTLPWYLTWGFVIAAAFPWQKKHLAVVVTISVFLVLVYYPSGEQAFYDWWFIIGVVVASGYAGLSLLRPDPLGLKGLWRKNPTLSLPANQNPAQDPNQDPALNNESSMSNVRD